MKLQYQFLSRTKFTRLEDQLLRSNAPYGAFDIYTFSSIFTLSGDWAPKRTTFPRVLFIGSFPMSKHTVLRLVRNPKRDAHEYAVHVLKTCLSRAGEDPVAAYACTVALHELLNLIEEEFHAAWDSFHLWRLMVKSQYGDNAFPQSVYERAVKLEIITRPSRHRREYPLSNGSIQVF